MVPGNHEWKPTIGNDAQSKVDAINEQSEVQRDQVTTQDHIATKCVVKLNSGNGSRAHALDCYTQSYE